MKVTLAVLLQDDFSGTFIQGAEHEFWLDGYPIKPARKPEGFYVFTKPLQESSILVIQAKGYLAQAITLSRAENGVVKGVLQVRLQRTTTGRFGSDSYCIEGTAKPCEGVLALSQEEQPLRFQSSGERDGKPWILLQGYANRPLVGRRFCLIDGKTKTYFLIESQDKDGVLILEKPFNKKFTSGCEIRRVYTATANEKGVYHLYVDPSEEGKPMKATASKEVGKWAYKYAPLHS